MSGDDPLEPALDTLRAAHPAPAVPLLVEQLVVGRWTTSRAALSALKREGERGLTAAPAVSAWLAQSVQHPDIARHGHALREALQALRGWWQATAKYAAGDGPVAEAARALAAHFTAAVEPAVRALLDGDVGAAHRGAVDYLAAAATDKPAAVEALRRFLARDPAGDDDAYTRAAAITALAGLSEAPDPPPRSTAADAPAEPEGPESDAESVAEAEATALPLTAPRPDLDAPLDPLGGDLVSFVDTELVPLLVREFEDGPPGARLAALSALNRLGTRAERAAAAMWRIIRQGPQDDPEIERLRQRALSVFVPLVTRRLPPDSPSTIDAGRVETARTLLIEVAMGDQHPRVRAEAVEALSRLGDDDEAVWRAAIEAVTAGEPVVRGASTRLVAVLGALARRGRLSRPPE